MYTVYRAMKDLHGSARENLTAEIYRVALKW
jgi:hypothetical protein